MPNYRKLACFDFDGTLVKSPHPDDLIKGIPLLAYYDQWLVDHNKPPRKFTGFWGRTETLLPPIFGEWDEEGTLIPPATKLNVTLAETARECYEDEDTLSVLMTGRHLRMTHNYKGTKQHVCKTILDEYGIKFDQYHYGSTGQPTLTFKLNVIQSTLRDIQTLRDVEIWEDRHAHTSEFWNFVKYYKKIGKLDEGFVHQIEDEFDDMPEDA